jgi:hypothetical protein
MSTAERNRNRSRVSRELQQLPIYHQWIPLATFDEILQKHGFDALESAIYCGREGRAVCPVGHNTFLAFTWHKMEETGRYEIVAYVS